MSEHDFLNQLGELALGSRLKRLSDRMMKDAAKVYQSYQHDVQPKWFVLLALLQQQGSVSVVQASQLLGVSQPAVSQFCRELLAKKLINSKAASNDSRKKMLTLTTKGSELVDQMQPMWQAVEQAAALLCEQVGNDFYQSIQRCEQLLDEQSLYQRVMEIKHDKA